MSGPHPRSPAPAADPVLLPQERVAREQLAAEPKPGNRIGPYRLVRLLGMGTTGRVFEVEHERIGRRAAMKTLAAEHAVRVDAIKRLFAEALAVNRINNPHIVEVTDVVEGGVHRVVDGDLETISPVRVNALVMELLEGQSLARLETTVRPLPPERFLPILAQVSEALAAAHAAGFVHRDLKPDNIFLIEREGQTDFVKLLDFGLAKVIRVDPGERKLPSLQTLDGTFLGTPAYASPEQSRGKDIGHETDVYSLGVVLYELVAGHLPFQGQSIADFILQHLNSAPPPLPSDILQTSLGRTLDAIINRCLEKDPAARFSADELTSIFWALSRGESVRFTVKETYRAPTVMMPRRRRRPLVQIAWGLGLGLVAALVADGVVGRMQKSREERATAPRPRGPVTLPAPPRPPTATPPPRPAEAPELTTISFDSAPRGAEVRLAGESTAIGVTPFQYRFPRQADAVEVELRVPGYETGRVTLSTAVNHAVNLTLTKLGPSSRRARANAAAPDMEKEATIDPFQK